LCQGLAVACHLSDGMSEIMQLAVPSALCQSGNNEVGIDNGSKVKNQNIVNEMYNSKIIF